MTYDDEAVHRLMLEDEVRTRAYERAIHAMVKPGQTVLDFGCGSGILSFFAARANASRVFAVDRSRFIRVARMIARDNGFDNISFFHGDGKNLKLQERVDVIVSEWMGHFAFTERMLEPLVEIRNTHLKPGGTMIPQKVSLWACLVCDPDVHRKLGMFRRKPYDLDFSAIGDWPFHRIGLDSFKPSQVLDARILLSELDLLQCNGPPSVLKGTLIPKERAEAVGICGWFEAQLTKEIRLGTGPWDAETHWRQVFFPFVLPLRVEPGDRVEITIVPTFRDPEEGTLWKWTVNSGGKRQEMDNYVHSAWVSRELPEGPLT